MYEERVKLALLLGWTRSNSTVYDWVTPDGKQDAVREHELNFDPFKKTADDYAVLKWYQDHGTLKGIDHAKFADQLYYGQLYKVGNYARALLAAKEL